MNMHKPLLSAFLILSISALSSWVSAKENFRIFNATAYIDTGHHMANAGLFRLPIIFEPQMDFGWAKSTDHSGLPNEKSTKKAIYELTRNHDSACLNVEVWPLTPDTSPTDVSETIQKLKTLVRWSHEAAPEVKIGFYGILPINNYWGAVIPDSKEGRWGVAVNQELSSLAEDVDVVFPSLYTFYTDKNQWETFAVSQIAAARQFNKPVYVFLWPQYHNSNKDLGLSFIPRDYWRRQLELAHKYADGIVIWGGWNWKENKPAVFEPNALWWQETLDFITQLQGSDSLPNPPEIEN